jgi:hypothetical protein
LSASCRKSPTGPADVAAFGGVSDYVLSAAISGSAARISPSTGVVTGTAGPLAVVNGPTTVAKKNGSATYSVSAAAPFQKVIVTVNGKTGYIQIDLPGSVSSQNVDLFFNALPANFTLQFQVVGAAGAGPAASVLTTSS